MPLKFEISEGLRDRIYASHQRQPFSQESKPSESTLGVVSSGQHLSSHPRPQRHAAIRPVHQVKLGASHGAALGNGLWGVNFEPAWNNRRGHGPSGHKLPRRSTRPGQFAQQLGILGETLTQMVVKEAHQQLFTPLPGHQGQPTRRPRFSRFDFVPVPFERQALPKLSGHHCLSYHLAVPSVDGMQAPFPLWHRSSPGAP